MKKRVFAAFLAVMMALSLTLPALAEGVKEAKSASRSVVSGTCGDDLTWELDLGTGVMTISGTGEIYDYPDWSSYSMEITSVVIGNGCTGIGSGTFSCFESLVSIELPGSLTSIGYMAFSGCCSLASIELPAGLASIGEWAFEGCSSLTSIALPEGTAIGDWAFFGCSSLASVSLPADLTGIGAYVFRDCSSLTSIEIPSGVTSVGDAAFNGCSSLTSAVFAGEPPTDFGSDVFGWCPGDFCIYYMPEYAELWAPNGEISWNGYPILPYGQTYDPDHLSGVCGENLSWTLDVTAGVLTITGTGAMYDYTGEYGMTNVPWQHYYLNEIELPEGLTHIGNYAFCDGSFVSVELPDSLTSIGDYAFMRTGLTSLELPSGLTSVGEYAFFEIPITSLTIPAGLTSIGDSAFGRLTRLTSLVLPESVTSIGAYVFRECSALTSIDLPSGLTSIGAGAFANCSRLSSLTLPAGVTSIGDGAFSGCGFASVTFMGEPPTEFGSNVFPSAMLCIYYQPENASSWSPNGETEWNGYPIFPVGEVGVISGTCGDNLVWTLDTTGLLTISGTGAMYDYQEGQTPWYGYRSVISSIVIEEGATKIGEEAFDGCYAVMSVQLPSTVTYIGPFALQATYIASVELPAGLTYLGDGAFYNCTALESIVIPDGVTSIGDYTFYGCSSLVSVDLPEGVTSIGQYAFRLCSLLESVELPDGLTSMGEGVFAQCSALTSVDIPDGVASIPQYAFYQCSALASAELPSSLTFIGSGAFYLCSSLPTIEIPAGVTNVSDSAFAGCYALSSAYFLGEPPTGSSIFYACAADFCIYYLAEHVGSWSPNGETTWNGYPIVMINTYTVTWVNDDGTVLETDANVPYGTTPTYDGATPTKPATAQYTYTFAGWTPAIAPVEGDVTYTATYTSTVNTYTVTFVDGLTNEVISEVSVEYGGAAAAPEAPVHEGYTFVGWDGEFDNITENITVTALYEEDQPEIILGDADGSGSVDISDALIVLRASMGLVEMTPEIEAASDANGDGHVDISDALLILRFAMGLITSF